jgi:DNA (cytosine-5)-methyltransferase 1
MRDRMFLIAYHESLGETPRFPPPTRWIDLPRGYEGTRQVALKHLAEDDPYYVEPIQPTTDLERAVTSEEALRDLPRFVDHLEGRLRRGVRRFTQLAPYRSDLEPSAYGHVMRSWPGFENAEGVYDHVIRSLPRDYAIFAEMKAGDQYPQAFEVAQRIFARRLHALERQHGRSIPEGSDEWRQLRAETVPPYDVKKFPNKWRKMEAHAPSRTLMAHIGKDTYSHIHYDGEQARTISVREAARLQSFPDGFTFVGAMNSSFRQIGNAVPPLLAKQLADEMFNQFAS